MIFAESATPVDVVRRNTPAELDTIEIDAFSFLSNEILFLRSLSLNSWRLGISFRNSRI